MDVTGSPATSLPIYGIPVPGIEYPFIILPTGDSPFNVYISNKKIDTNNVNVLDDIFLCSRNALYVKEFMRKLGDTFDIYLQVTVTRHSVHKYYSDIELGSALFSSLLLSIYHWFGEQVELRDIIDIIATLNNEIKVEPSWSRLIEATVVSSIIRKPLIYRHKEDFIIPQKQNVFPSPGKTHYRTSCIQVKDIAQTDIKHRELWLLFSKTYSRVIAKVITEQDTKLLEYIDDMDWFLTKHVYGIKINPGRNSKIVASLPSSFEIILGKGG